MQIEYAKVSALGDRQDNQDRAAVVASEDAALMLVFDGMGGHSDGAMAAETGMKVVQDLFVAEQQPIFDPQGFLYGQAPSSLTYLGQGVFRGEGFLAPFFPDATGIAKFLKSVVAHEVAHQWWYAQVGNDQALRQLTGMVVGNRSGDVFVGESVEAVALQAFVAVARRQRQTPRDRRLDGVECSIETRHLRQLRCRVGDRADRRQIVRLMVRRQRRQCIQLLEQGRSNQRRGVTRAAAVHHAVAYTAQ